MNSVKKMIALCMLKFKKIIPINIYVNCYSSKGGGER